MEMSLCICSLVSVIPSEVLVSLNCSPCFCLSSYTVSPLSPQDYESKLQALQKQVETRSLAAETTEEEEEEEEGEFKAKNNLDIAKPKGTGAITSFAIDRKLTLERCKMLHNFLICNLHGVNM